MSSRRTPSGSEKYSETSLSICVAMPASSSRSRGFPLLSAHRDGEMVEAAQYLGVRREAKVGEVEERQGVVVPEIEEEVRRALVVPVFEEFDQRKPEELLIEADRPFDV